MSADDHRLVPVLSVLDLAPAGPGQSSTEAVASLLDHARRADELGLRRFWIGEHHNSPTLLSASPPVLIGAVAAATARIRVGAGGMLQPHHVPLMLAETFGTLEALHPGRIDLGIGRALGADPATAHLLSDAASRAQFVDAVRELMLRQRGLPDRAGTAIAVPGDDRPPPPLWVLGSSAGSARRAAELGLPYAYAHHLSGTGAAEALADYRSRFVPSAQLAQPYAIVSITAVCGVDDEHAQLLALPVHLGDVRGTRSLASPSDVGQLGLTPDQRAALGRLDAAQAVGGPERVAERLEQLYAETRADELMLAGVIADPADRTASLERVVNALGAATPAR